MKMKKQLITFATMLMCILWGATSFAYDTYDIGASFMGYDSATVYIPDGNGPFPATTMSGGWTNTKEDMEWICEDLVNAGFVVICFTPQRRLLALPWIWQRGQEAIYDTLLEENSDSGSMLYGKVDTSRVNIAGFSMGGGGVIQTANEGTTDAKTAIAMAPWEVCTIRPLSPCNNRTDNIDIPVFIFGGTNDRLVYDNELNNMYNDVPGSTERLGIIFDGMNHYDLFGVEGTKGEQRDRVVTYMIAFLKVYLVGDSSYQTFLDGNELDDNIDDGWFAMYKYNDTEPVPYNGTIPE